MKYFDMLKRFNGLKFKGKPGDTQSKEDISNANKTNTQESFRPGATGMSKSVPGKEGEKDVKDNLPLEIDPKEDINNIENKFNPKREEAYWLEDLYDRLEKCLLMGKEPLEKFGFLFNQYKADLDIEPEKYDKREFCDYYFSLKQNSLDSNESWSSLVSTLKKWNDVYENGQEDNNINKYNTF